MGYPVFSFQLLESLFTQWNATAEERIDSNVLQGFKAVAIVLFDPDRHADMQEVMNRQFAILDEYTDRTLLFFSLISERKYIPSVVRERTHYLRLTEDINDAQQTGNLKGLWFTLMALGLNSSELPGVVLFKPNDPQTLYFIPVSAKSLANILFSITDMLKMISLDELMSHKTWITSYKGTVLLQPKLLEGSVAHLSMVSSATLYGLNPNAFWNLQRRDRIQDMVDLLESSVREIRRLAKAAGRKDTRLKHEIREALDRFVSVWMYCKSMLSLNSPPPVTPVYTIPNKLLGFIEPESQVLIETVVDTANHLSGKPMDFAHVVFSVGKILEVEAQHSLLHLIRDQVSIDARTYFMQVDPAYASHYSTHYSTMWGGGAITIPGGRKKYNTFLNSSDGHTGQLKLPKIKELYDSLTQFTALISHHPSLFDPADWAVFEAEREVLRQKRNDAAHELRNLPESEFVAALNSLITLCNANFFEVSDQYKKAIRAGGSTPVVW